MIGMQQILLFDDFDSTEIDDSIFDLPPEIAAMVTD